MKTITIVFILPGNTFTNNFLVSWSEILLWCSKNNINPMLVNKTGSNVYHLRNSCLGGDTLRGRDQKPFNGKIDYDYMMWIDSDQVFTINNLINLLNMNKDIASGLYLMQDGKNYATVKDWDIDFYKKNGHFKFLNIQDVEKYKSENNKILECSYTGFGFMLIKKGVFESLSYPWFRPIWEEDEFMCDFSSEDVGFCKMIQKLGYKINVNLDVIVGHEKSIVLHPFKKF